jgi:peptide/nickel transport system substrate-binding protein
MFKVFSARRIISARVMISLVCAGLALPTFGNAHQAVASNHQAGGPLIVNVAQSPATLDPAEACGLWDLTIMDNTYVRLTQYGSKPGPNGTTAVDPSHILPYFAKSWTISHDGLMYTFKLHSGAKFPSGRPMDAQAVKYSFERSIKMGGCGEYFVYDGIYTPPLVKSIAAPNPTTVVITLSRPDPNVLQDWAQPACSIVDPGVVEAHGGVQAGKINEWMAGHTAGSGPFLLQDYEPNTRAVLVANPHYFGPPPGSSRIVINFINSDPTLLLQARSGVADVTLGLTKQSTHSLVGNPRVRIIANDATAWEQIGLPNATFPFNNVKFRAALTYAVPYQQLLQRVAFGYGTLFYGPFPPVMPEFNAQLEKPRPFDLTRAQALIKASGVPTPVSVNMVIPEGNPIEEQIATVVQGIWRQLGVSVTISKLSATDYINALEQHKAQSYVRYDGPGVIEAGYLLGYDLKCHVGFNLSDICIPQADRLLAQGRMTLDRAKRQAIWNQIIRLWVADSPKIPVYADKFTTVLNKRVKAYFYSHELDLRTWSR